MATYTHAESKKASKIITRQCVSTIGIRCMHTCTCTCTCICTVHIHVHVHVYVHVHACTCNNISVHVCTYLYCCLLKLCM